MAYFQPFKKSTGAKTPQFIAAAIGQAEAEAAANQANNEMRSQMLLGAGSTYKGITSKMEKDPIAEALRSGWGKMTGGGTEAWDTNLAAAQETVAGGGADTITGLNPSWEANLAAAQETVGSGAGVGEGAAMLDPSWGANLAAAQETVAGGTALAEGAGTVGAVGEAAALTPAVTGAVAPAGGGIMAALASNPVGWGIGGLAALAAILGSR